MSNNKHGKDSSPSSGNYLLDNLQISCQKVLELAQRKGRSKCPKCNSSRMFYCYTCYVPVESVPIGDIPSVKLPLKIEIIKHPNETDGKSTAVHAKILANEDVTIYTYPCIPDYDKHKHDIILVFPGPHAMPLKDSLLYLSHCNTHNEDSTSEPTIKRKKIEADSNGSENKDLKTEDKNLKIDCLKKVVFIDSTWNQTNKIMSDERLQAVSAMCTNTPRVVLSGDVQGYVKSQQLLDW
ncbi:tRNA-uridine aminocarboxypropyltransferase 1 isoform X3 [Pseudophryne corroboree]|uniref:tRNA-uridine aminocarboxypropyltransferase 1 isoform X3 n=1 Tax=Pseudophryne corroboree TaxID=495146 RepID=UPI003081732E